MDGTTANCPKSILVFDEADLNSLNEDLISVLAATSYITQEIREFVKLADAAKPITDQGTALDHITKTQRQVFQRCLILRAVSFLEMYSSTKRAARNDSTGILTELRRSNAPRIKALQKSRMKEVAEKVRHQAFAHIDLEGIKNSYREWTEEKSTQFILDPDGLNTWDTFGETVVYVWGCAKVFQQKVVKEGHGRHRKSKKYSRNFGLGSKTFVVLLWNSMKNC
ncbi:hypothetical protein [Halocynthiibacter sp.]|uniref:hypothetical protein n=1 Tax=Halocynthiibacter sp. TaxID=1979210 RepID=UPI003C4B582C